MAPQTKAVARTSSALKIGVGYPDHWRSRRHGVVRGDAWQLVRAGVFEYKRNLPAQADVDRSGGS